MCEHAGFRHEASILPFELHVLEVAIGDVCQLCSGLVKELESSGHPILDTLVKHVRPASSPIRICPITRLVSRNTCSKSLAETWRLYFFSQRYIVCVQGSDVQGMRASRLKAWH